MRLVLSTVALVACTSLASAADLGGPYEYEGSIKDGPIATAPYNWTGLYFGGHVGYGWGEWDVDLSHSSGAIHYNDPFIPARRSLSADDGWLGGFQAGYNHKIGSMVVGLETDVSWTGMEAGGYFIAAKAQPNNSAWDIDTSLDVFGTVRARLGVAVSPQVLVYGTGGFAWGRVAANQATEFIYVPPAVGPTERGARTSGDVNHFGWTVGGGLEWALSPSLSVKGEYLYVDLGKENYMLNGTTPTGSPYTETFSTDLSFHTARIGLNYKFGH